MAEQPLSYGIDAGRAVDDSDLLIDEARLERIVPAGTWKTSAVLIPAIPREGTVSLILTTRTTHLASHGGQIAFPGGKIEPSDATPVDTALREAHEEIALPPKAVTPLALLDLHKTGTGYRIIPVIGLVDEGFVPVAEPGEVHDVFEVPLAFITSKDQHVPHIGQWKGQRILFNSLTYEDRFIWGATAAILKNLVDRLYGSDVGES
jgi:8-oxo-dGTP pyrophosphatase MutT (NUDIX family)